MKYEKMLLKNFINPTYHISALKKTIHGTTSIHLHEFFEIELVIGGSGKNFYNGVEYDISRGSVYLMTPADFHKVTATPELELITVMFDDVIISEKLLSAILNKSANYCIRLDGEEFDNLCFYAEQLISERAVKDAYTNVFVENLLNSLLIKIIRKAVGADNCDSRWRDTVLNKALSYLYIHFRENPSLAAVAAICGYSPNYFSKIFTEFTGKGYTDFLNSLKLQNAKILLTSSTKSVSEIAFYCGFTSLSNFYRVFRDEVGMTPIEYKSCQ